MDTSHLAQQVNTIIGQLHGLFDEIGVSNHDREAREAEVRNNSVRAAGDVSVPVLKVPMAALCGSVRCAAQPSPPRDDGEEEHDR
jgi:hypothetical protein